MWDVGLLIFSVLYILSLYCHCHLISPTLSLYKNLIGTNKNHSESEAQNTAMDPGNILKCILKFKFWKHTIIVKAWLSSFEAYLFCLVCKFYSRHDSLCLLRKPRRMCKVVHLAALAKDTHAEVLVGNSEDSIWQWRIEKFWFTLIYHVHSLQNQRHLLQGNLSEEVNVL